MAVPRRRKGRRRRSRQGPVEEVGEVGEEGAYVVAGELGGQGPEDVVAEDEEDHPQEGPGGFPQGEA